MNDTQEKYIIKYLASISKSLAALVKETKKQNELTMAMIQAAEAAEDEVHDDEPMVDDISAVNADDYDDEEVEDDDE